MAPTGCRVGALAFAAGFLLLDARGAIGLAAGGQLRSGNRGAILTRESLSAASDGDLVSKNSTLTEAVGANVTGQVNAVAQAKVFFLFLAVDKISNLDVWLHFFASAHAQHYRVLVHCKLESCKRSLQGTLMHVVPTVPSYYCTDLVSPMNQLLAEAIKMDPIGHPMDKFSFVSDSSLPAKPFYQLHAVLTSRVGSSFCVFPSDEWADVDAGMGVQEVAPKAHQWLTLSRGHAHQALTRWWAGNMHDFMTRFRMNTKAYTWANNTFADSRNFGCLDEFWHMAAIFGPIKRQAHSPQAVAYLTNFAGGPLQVADKAGWQGVCDTFVVWAKYLNTQVGLSGMQSPFAKLHAHLDPASVPHGGNNQRPGWWDKLSTNGMRAIRWSHFLFVRKFVNKPGLTDSPSVGGSFASWYNQLVLN